MTDVELEVIAQTWSEHCKHKIFASKIRYADQSGSLGGTGRPCWSNSSAAAP